MEVHEDSPKPEIKGCLLDGKITREALFKRRSLIYSENVATEIIAKQHTMAHKLSDGMAILEKSNKKNLSTQFQTLLTDDWKIKADKARTLILYRDSGPLNGVYPELGSGPAIKAIDGLIKKFSTQDGAKLKLMTAGNKDKISGLDPIGEHWTKSRNHQRRPQET